MDPAGYIVIGNATSIKLSGNLLGLELDLMPVINGEGRVSTCIVRIERQC